MIDNDFCPGCYTYRAKLAVDSLFWEELTPGGEYKLDEPGFHIPKRNLRKNWPGVLYSIFVETESKFIDYDPNIASLPLEITPEMIESTGRAETPEEFLFITREGLDHRISNYRNLKKTFPNLREPEFTEFEERVLKWHTNYGFLVPTKLQSTHAPVLHPAQGQFECRREYLFHVPNEMYAEIEEDPFNSKGKQSAGYWSGIMLSLGWEPNSNRCIWGFRKDLTTEFSMAFPKGFVEAMNYLIVNLEETLKE